jgi:hypothetical protein
MREAYQRAPKAAEEERDDECFQQPMHGKRLAWVLGSVLAAGAFAQEQPAGFQKAYFGATKAGTWAKYRMTAPGAQEGFTTYSRLPDEGGVQRLLVRVDFTVDGRKTTTYSDYTLEDGFSLEKDAVAFGKAVESATTWEGNNPPEDLPDEAIEEMQDAAPDFGGQAHFVGTEKVSGRSCDHYRYTQKHPGDTVTIETGDIWLDPTVPFGVVRQAGVLKDESGKFFSSYAMLLVDTGTGAVAPRSARRASASPPVKLAEAYADGQVEIRVETADGRLNAVFYNRSGEAIRLTIPSGPTALEIGAPVGTLRLDSASTWLFDLAPGETSEAVELGQGGSPRVLRGRFTAHRSGGKAVFAGDAEFETAK